LTLFFCGDIIKQKRQAKFMSDEQKLDEQSQEDEEVSSTEANEDSENNAEESDGKSTISADLIRGHINTIILRTLYERDKYGYEIMTEIEQKSHGQYSLKQPTLYSALKRLETQGYIKAYWKTDDVTLGGRRKYFTLTESGKEITEKNQAEWEYSRTVIDNLISDRSFDFSKPAPTPVDFKILKNSVSRVPNVKGENEQPEAENTTFNPYAQITPAALLDENTTSLQTSKTEFSEQYTTINERDGNRVQRQENVPNESELRAQEERKINHENYLKLISTPAPQTEIKSAPVKPEEVSPTSDEIDTEKLIYNNKPATERDYKNLIDGIFNKAIKADPRPRPVEKTAEPVPQQQQQANTYTQPRVVINYAEEKGRADGLKVNLSNSSTEYGTTATGTTYDFGMTLFKCSAIVGIVLMLEFVLTLVFKENLGVTLAYPFVIFAIALAQLAVFGLIALSGYGKHFSKPTTTTYISISIILTILCILIICVVALLINVNFSSTGDIMAKMVVPSLTALNIPIFTSCFYIFSK
jgi:PadR family transcriptional regulator PadR